PSRAPPSPYTTLFRSRVHIALMGLERIVPDWPSASLVLESLARSATGQRLSVYTNVITGPRRADDPDGPEEVHVVIVDNGRTARSEEHTSELQSRENL